MTNSCSPRSTMKISIEKKSTHTKWLSRLFVAAMRTVNIIPKMNNMLVIYECSGRTITPPFDFEMHIGTANRWIGYELNSELSCVCTNGFGLNRRMVIKVNQNRSAHYIQMWKSIRANCFLVFLLFFFFFFCVETLSIYKSSNVYGTVGFFLSHFLTILLSWGRR